MEPVSRRMAGPCARPRPRCRAGLAQLRPGWRLTVPSRRLCYWKPTPFLANRHHLRYNRTRHYHQATGVPGEGAGGVCWGARDRVTGGGYHDYLHREENGSGALTQPVQPLRMVQLSDFHLFADRDGRLLGLNTQFSLEKVLERVCQERPAPDFVV